VGHFVEIYSCHALPLNFDGRIVLVEPKIDPEEFPPAIPPPADEAG
jgi:hypothetical protein